MAMPFGLFLVCWMILDPVFISPVNQGILVITGPQKRGAQDAGQFGFEEWIKGYSLFGFYITVLVCLLLIAEMLCFATSARAILSNIKASISP